MQYFILTLIFMGIMILAMSVGVIFSNKRLKGSCGGLGAVMGEDCEFCDVEDKCQGKKGEENTDQKSDDRFSFV
ncbi:hypothetical protein CMK14_04040 [Candidatus Poribacteria bacterium]|jgi:hypothetical protein|nr:hypothetical protein [Candidatus Poribacteria bacterium]|tara:strand:+ start:117 stop:338 length:222 start_codon:yes stop_codon:yes gene_type:complete